MLFNGIVSIWFIPVISPYYYFWNVMSQNVTLSRPPPPPLTCDVIYGCPLMRSRGRPHVPLLLQIWWSLWCCKCLQFIAWVILGWQKTWNRTTGGLFRNIQCCQPRILSFSIWKYGYKFSLYVTPYVCMTVREIAREREREREEGLWNKPLLVFSTLC